MERISWAKAPGTKSKLVGKIWATVAADIADGGEASFVFYKKDVFTYCSVRGDVTNGGRAPRITPEGNEVLVYCDFVDNLPSELLGNRELWVQVELCCRNGEGNLRTPCFLAVHSLYNSSNPPGMFPTYQLNAKYTPQKQGLCRRPWRALESPENGKT